MTIVALLIAICFSGPWTGTPAPRDHDAPRPQLQRAVRR